MFGINDALSSFGGTSDGKKMLMYPFHTLGNAATPDFWRTCLSYIEYLWCTGSPVYSAALKSAIALNITEITYTDVEGEGELSLSSRNTIERDLMPILGGTKELMDLGCDLMCYGNAFRSLYFPFTRYVVCPGCKSQYGLKYVLDTPDKFNFQYKLSSVELGADETLPMMGTCGCPDCGYRGKVYIRDMLSSSKQDISIVSWRPQDIYIESGAFDGKKCIYHFRANAEIKRNVTEGRTLTLLTYPMELLAAINQNGTFQFNDGELFHLRDTTLSGVLTYGWGIPRILSHFQLVWQLACLYKINEAIAIDYSEPKRVLTPAPRAGASDGVTADPAGTIDLLPYLYQAKQMWETNEHARVTFLPFPVQYQLLGGEAKNLVPDNLLQMAEDTLLSVVDVPVELYRNTLAVEGAPLALTLFENKWRWFRNESERFMFWLSNKLTPRLGWSPVKLGLLPLKISSDIARATMDMQLAAQQSMSWSSAFKGIGKNYLEEQRRIIDEQKTIADMMKELEQQGALAGLVSGVTQSQNPASAGQQPPPPEAMGGDPMAGGMGMPPGGGGGMSPQGMGMMGVIGSGMTPNEFEKMSPVDTLEMATMIAQQVVSAGPGRRQMLNELRNQLPETLYSAVKKEVEKLDRQMASEGKMMMQQQMGGGQPPM